MPVITGRTNNVYGWTAYDWANDYRYVAGGWTVDTTTTVAAREATVVVTPPVSFPKPGARLGLLYGRRSGQGYDRKSVRVASAVAANIKLIDLRPATQYYLIPLLYTADGEVVRGPESGLLTTGTLPPLEINPYAPLILLLLLGGALAPDLPEPPAVFDDAG